jgi:hypothetical protein
MKTSHGIFPHSLLKNIFISILFSLAGYLGYSQVSFGVKSGMNIATTKGLLEYPKNKIGWYGGGFATIPLHKKFFLQTEVLYSSKGNGEKKYTALKTVFNFNYLNVPILLGYNIDYRTCLLFGPEFGYLTSAHEAFGDGDNINVSKSYSPKFDAGLDVGLNYKILKRTGIEVRYNYGFKFLYYIDGAGVHHTENKAGNRVFQIGLNYIL